MCEWLGVPESGFYGMAEKSGSGARDCEEKGEIKLSIWKVFGDSDGGTAAGGPMPGCSVGASDEAASSSAR